MWLNHGPMAIDLLAIRCHLVPLISVMKAMTSQLVVILKDGRDLKLSIKLRSISLLGAIYSTTEMVTKTAPISYRKN